MYQSFCYKTVKRAKEHIIEYFCYSARMKELFPLKKECLGDFSEGKYDYSIIQLFLLFQIPWQFFYH